VLKVRRMGWKVFSRPVLMFWFGFCSCCLGDEQLFCSEAKAPSQNELTSTDSSEWTCA
jgi:hypothetical protein